MSGNTSRLKPGPMSKDDLRSHVAGLITDAEAHCDGDPKKARLAADDYYRGRPYGDERPGRSAVVTREVLEAVESVLPMLLEPLCATEELVTFKPQGPEDEKPAEQATEYVNFIFNTDNDGFTVLYDTVKDGLTAAIGVVKVGWVVEREAQETAFEGLSDDQFGRLAGDPEVVIVQHSDRPTGTGPVHDCRLRRVGERGRVRVEAVPPEEFIFSPYARTMDDPYLKAHRVTRTVGELLTEGYDAAILENLPADEDETRGGPAGGAVGLNGDDGAGRRVTITECYLRIDEDGDGIAERRRIVVAGRGRGDGGGLTILLDEPCDDVPFAVWSPIRDTHAVSGMSLAELVMDLQRIKSYSLRGTLDAVAMANNPRVGAVESRVNIDDLLDSRPAGVVRVKGGVGDVFPIQTSGSAEAMGMLGALDAMVERRTGVSQSMQGLDMDALAKGAGRTATGVAALMAASQLRVKLILRLYGERLLGRMYRLILRAVIRHQDRARMVRLRGGWVEMDPRPWNAEMDMAVGVGLGLGDKAQQVAVLGQVLDAQKEALQAGGLDGMVTPANIHETLRRLVELGGMKSADPFFNAPKTVPPGPPPPPQPTADMLVMRDVEMAKIAAKEREKAAELASAERRAAAELALKERLGMADLRLRHGELGVKALHEMGPPPPPPVPPPVPAPGPAPGPAMEEATEPPLG